MNYSVTGEQLTSIADAIRTKRQLPPSGKNLCNPDTMTAIVEKGKRYRISMNIKWDGVHNSVGTVSYPLSYDDIGYIDPTPSAGTMTRESSWIDVPEDGFAVLSFTEGLEISEVQIEEGNTATSYEPYQPQLLEFPDDFVSEIGDIDSVKQGTVNFPEQNKQISPGAVTFIGDFCFVNSVKDISITSTSQDFPASKIYFRFMHTVGSASVLNVYAYNSDTANTKTLAAEAITVNYQII